MERKIEAKNGKISENSFLGIREDILKAANKENSVTQIIDLYIEYLNNYRNPDYVKKTNCIDIITEIQDGKLDTILSNLKQRLLKMRKEYSNREKKEKRQLQAREKEENWTQIEDSINKAAEEGKQGTKKEIVERLIESINDGTFEYEFKGKEKKDFLKKLKGMITEIDKQQAAAEESKRKKQEEEYRREIEKRNAESAAEKAMEQIQSIVDREYKAGNVENKAQFLSIIRNTITGETKGIDLGIKMGEVSQEHLLKMIDSTIKTEKDEVYFEQVRKFTDDFQFLRVYPEIERGKHGVSKRVKFTDSESYERFCDLREKLQKEYNEEMGIQLLINSNEIDNIDKRILSERKKVIEKENERNLKIKTEGIRYEGETK